MPVWTVRNLDEDLIRRLCIRSSEAEHRAILHDALIDDSMRPSRPRAADRLAAFRSRIADRGAESSAELLAQARTCRLQGCC